VTQQIQLRAGMILMNRYQIVKILGRGGMGIVYLVEDLKLKGKLWALKEASHTKKDYQRFVDEAEILVRMQHPHLPQIIDYYPPNMYGQSYLIMEYIRGETLARRFERDGRKMSAEHAVHIALQLCDLFHYLHHELPFPIIYRDLKPSNIMVNESLHVTLIDFGIARKFDHSKHQDTLHIGTAGFAAPEQFGGSQSDQRSDLFTLGALLYYLLSGGQYCFTGKPVESWNDTLPSPLCRIIGKLTAPVPEDRYKNARETREDLAQFLAKSNRAQKTAYPLLQPAVPVIGITGTGERTGCTHTAIMLAYAAALQGLKVALVEANSSSDFQYIRMVYEGVDSPDAGRMFRIRGVDFFPSGIEWNLTALYKSGYTCIILDTGCYNASPWREDFLKTSLKIVVAPGCEWRRRDVVYFIRNHCDLPWIVGVPLCGEQVLKDITKQTGHESMLLLPYEPDPFALSREGISRLGQLIYSGVPLNKSITEKKRKFAFFRNS